MQLVNGADIQRAKKAKIIIYSKPGVGKTTVAGLLPGKTLMLSVDGTEQVLQGYPNVDVARINNEDPHTSIIQFFGIAKANIEKYDNIFIDNISHYEKLWFIEKGETTKLGMPERSHYALYDNHIIKLVETFNQLDANIIFTAWETTRQVNGDDGMIYTEFIPEIREKVVNHVLGICHVVARLVKKNDGARGFILEGNQTVYAKNHLDSRKGCLQDELLNIKGEKNE